MKLVLVTSDGDDQEADPIILDGRSMPFPIINGKKGDNRSDHYDKGQTKKREKKRTMIVSYTFLIVVITD